MRNRLAHYWNASTNGTPLVATGFLVGLGWFTAESMFLVCRTYLVAIAGMLGMVP